MKPTKSEIYEIAAEAEKWLSERPECSNEANIFQHSLDLSIWGESMPETAHAIIQAVALLKEMDANTRKEVSEWLPISGAPRDGTRILSCRPDFKDRPLVYAIVAYKDGEWHQQALMGGSLGVGYYPTHYRPLPKPPSEEV